MFLKASDERPFYGRLNEFRRLKNSLITQRKSLVLLQGSNGIGKTRIVQEFLRTHTNDFQGGIFWLDAARGEQRIEQFYNLLKILNPGIRHLKNLIEISQKEKKEDNLDPGILVTKMLVKAIKEFCLDKKSIWILDNFSRTSCFNDWVIISEIPTLIISHHTLIATFFDKAHKIDVHVLKQKAAVKLLTRRLGRNYDPKKANVVVEWIGRHPLALELLSCTMPEQTLDSWYEISQKRNPQITQEIDQIITSFDLSKPYRGYRRVVQVFQSSYNALTEEGKTLARLISQFAPEPISNDLIRDFHPGVLANLKRVYFLSDVDGFAGVMHRLLADFVRHISPDRGLDRRNARNVLLNALKNQQNANQLHPHAIAWWDRYSEKNLEDSNLGLEIAKMFYKKGFYEEAIKYLEEVISIIQKNQNQNSTKLFNVKYLLAETYINLTDFKNAENLLINELIQDFDFCQFVKLKNVEECNQNQLVDVIRDIFNIKSQINTDILKYLHLLSTCFRERTLYVLSKKIIENIITYLLMPTSFKCKVLHDFSILLSSEHNFGDAMEKLIEIEQIDENIPKDKKKYFNTKKPERRFHYEHQWCFVLLESPPDLLNQKISVIENFFNNAMSVGKKINSNNIKNEIINFIEKLWQKRKEVNGEYHPDTLITRSNLAVALKRDGKYSEALEHYEAIKSTYIRWNYKENHVDLITVSNNIASAYIDMAEKDHCLKAKGILEEILKNNLTEHPHRYKILLNYKRALDKLTSSNSD